MITADTKLSELVRIVASAPGGGLSRLVRSVRQSLAAEGIDVSEDDVRDSAERTARKG